MKGYEIINKIIDIAKKEKDMDLLDLMDMVMNDFSAYVDLCSSQENRLAIAKQRMYKEDYLNFVKTLDQQRRNIHNNCINNVNIINRLCETNNLPIFYNGDIDDRYAVGDFVGEIVNDAFKNRKR